MESHLKPRIMIKTISLPDVSNYDDDNYEMNSNIKMLSSSNNTHM